MISTVAGATRLSRIPWLCVLVLGLTLLGATAEALAHAVAEGDKGYIQEITGVNLLPFVYLGAKQMMTGYDHILFLFGVIFFLYRLQHIALYVSLFSRRPELLERGKAYFLRRGASSILIARFVPVMRSTVPIAAWMLGMGAGRFYAANIASALVWAPAHVLPGVLAATAFAGAGAISLRLGLAIALLLALLLATLKGLRAAALFGHRWVGQGRAALAAWAAPRRDLAGRLGRLAAAPEHAGLRGSALLIALAAFCLLAFLALLEGVVGREAIVRVDAAVLTLVGSLHTQWTDPVMLAATRLGDTAMNLVVSGAMIGWLLVRRQFRLGAGVLVAIAATAALMTAIKLGVHAGRPPLVTPIAPGFSFPSGHSTMAVVTLGLLAWLVAGGPGGRWRRLALAPILALIVLIPFSRVYLAAHWPSDVVGGMLLGAAVVAGFALVFRDLRHEAVAPLAMAAVVGVLLFGVGGARIATHIGPDMAVLRGNELRPSLLAEPWLAGGWRSLPAHRSDLGGEDEEPILLQWQGSAAALAAALAADRWQSLPGWSASALGRMIAPGTPAMDLPAMPVMDRGRIPALTLARPAGSPDQRLVLRAWSSGWQDPERPDQALLIASVMSETLAPIAGVLSLPRPSAQGDRTAIGGLAAAVQTDRGLAPRDGGCGGVLRLGQAAP
ncbi:phosphatase PAP2 family protein [Roseomonas frigidaquae]|uniref:Phosphatase PAP2 family protein n=2 Tax=Falsiroseomonas frigidaquae TaxID=487318 RepID=A0ABX1EYY2_9PROT|nr:phosphatase PAP2 family protein [Falsiroseomonas frigidaquae]NKE45253.1 phosphatase PAP2 family protein [Falsiroseomonas frigidaquae]